MQINWIKTDEKHTGVKDLVKSKARFGVGATIKTQAIAKDTRKQGHIRHIQDKPLK